MSTKTDNPITPESFEHLLRPAQERVRKVRTMHGIAAGARTGLQVAAIAAVVLALLRWLNGLGTASASGAMWWFVIPLACLVAGPIVGAVRAWRKPVTCREAAQRLDLGAGEHNRVATALALMDDRRSTPFAQAAVNAGYRRLVELTGQVPALPEYAARWRDLAAWGAVMLLGFVACMLAGNASASNTPMDVPAAIESREGLLAFADGASENELSESPRPRESRTARRATASGDARSAPPTETVAATTRNAGSAGSVAPDASEGSGESGSASSAGGAGGKSGGKGKQGERRKKPKAADKPAAPLRRTEEKKEEKSQRGSAIQGGGAGESAMSPAAQDWMQQLGLNDEESADEESEDGEVEEEKESSTHRGGVQPSLKDRNASPSRDLGISGKQGPPGTGRGGPTPPKKSRGAASLVLGIPIPDFVRGRLGPGTTRITQETVPPEVRLGDRSAATDMAAQAEATAVVDRYDVPAEWAGVVQRYLMSLHRVDGRAVSAGDEATE